MLSHPPTLLRLPADVLRDICDILIADYRKYDRQRPGLRSVVSLVRVCRAVHEVAADALWCTLPGLVPLGYTMPLDLWSFTDVDGEDAVLGKRIQMTFSRPLVENDFRRLNHYASRVRRVVRPWHCYHLPEHIRQCNASSKMLLALRVFLAGRPILPSLGVLELASSYGLRWGREQGYLNASATILTGPSVHALSLIYGSHEDWSDEVLFDVLTRTRQVTPHLRSLYIDYLSMPNAFSEHILSAAICCFHRLQSYSAVHLTLSPSALIHLARLPGLRVLHAPLSPNHVAILQEAGTTTPLFPALREVSLKERNAFADALDILDLISSSELHSIAFEVQQPHGDFQPLTDSSVPGAGAIFRSLGTREHKGAITSIHVSAGTRCSRLPSTVAAITEEHLKPLYACPALRDLVVNINCKFEIEDATVVRMARAWPLLRRLELGCDDLNRNEHEPTVSFSSIAYLAGACPQLENLRIGVDTSTVAQARSQNVRRPVSGKLTKLAVGWSVIDDPITVAGFLSETFPRLREVHHAWLTEEDLDGIEVPEEFDTNWDLWNDVDTLLPEFAKIRKQERNWAKAKHRACAGYL